jgi:hypothetical protein
MKPNPGEASRGTTFTKGVSGLLRARYENHLSQAFSTVDVEAITFVAQIGTRNADGGFSWADVAEYDTPTTIEKEGNWYDSCQPWSEDNIGYNAALPIPSDVWDAATAGKGGAIEITVTFTSGPPRIQRWEGPIFIPVA